MTYRLQGIFSVIADENRRALLDSLACGERTAGQLAAEFDISRSAIAKHLRILEQSGLVEIRTLGRNRVHRLTAEPLREVQDWIQSYSGFWDDRLTRLKALAESRSKPDKGLH